MKYGEIQYRDMREVTVPNIVVGRDVNGDWVDRFDESVATIAEGEVIIEGDDAISEYVESAFERFEDNHDLQAGLVAVHILHHYADRYGDTPATIHDELLSALTSGKRPKDANLYMFAKDAHPAMATALHSLMQTRAKQHTRLADLANDGHIAAHIDTLDIDEAIAQLIELRNE